MERWRELAADLLWEESKSCSAEEAGITSLTPHPWVLVGSAPAQAGGSSRQARTAQVEYTQTHRRHLSMPAEPVPSAWAPTLPPSCPAEPHSHPEWQHSALAPCCKRVSAADYGCQDQQDSDTFPALSLPTKNLLCTAAAQHSPGTRAPWYLCLLAELLLSVLLHGAACAPRLGSIPASLAYLGTTAPPHTPAN